MRDAAIGAATAGWTASGRGRFRIGALAEDPSDRPRWLTARRHQMAPAQVRPRRTGKAGSLPPFEKKWSQPIAADPDGTAARFSDVMAFSFSVG
jgi:hypothetical protein